MTDGIKITYIGDITCDRPLLNAVKTESGSYDFTPVFSRVSEFFEKSDLVVGNFETVCAGDDVGFDNRFMSCNTPDSLIVAMKKANIGFVSTANNHCLDQGISGLKRTLDVLDHYQVMHCGTYRNVKDRNTIVYKEIKGKKFAFLSYTYSTNESNTGIVLNESNDYHVGLLRKQRELHNNANSIKKVIFKLISSKQRQFIKRIIFRIKYAAGVPYMKIFIDTIQTGDTDNKYLDAIKKNIISAKENADCVVVLVHAGGQFNEKAGDYCDFLMNFLTSNGVDLVVENHPHVLQKVTKTNGKVTAYSLGSFNMSTSSDYVVHDNLPQYSIALHQYINEQNTSYKFSILKNIEDDKGNIVVWPVKDLYESIGTQEKKQLMNDIEVIYRRITGKAWENCSICDEYSLEVE